MEHKLGDKAREQQSRRLHGPIELTMVTACVDRKINLSKWPHRHSRFTIKPVVGIWRRFRLLYHRGAQSLNVKQVEIEARRCYAVITPVSELSPALFCIVSFIAPNSQQVRANPTNNLKIFLPSIWSWFWAWQNMWPVTSQAPGYRKVCLHWLLWHRVSSDNMIVVVVDFLTKVKLKVQINLAKVSVKSIRIFAIFCSRQQTLLSTESRCKYNVQ